MATALTQTVWMNFNSVRPSAVLRATAAGVVWGVTVAAGLCGLQFWNSGVICSGDVALTASLAIAGGLLTMSPFVFLSCNRQSTSRDAAKPANDRVH